MFSRAALPTIAPKKRFFSSTPSVKTDFTHVVIGAGVVGLAIARQLQSRQGVSTLLIEKHGAVGTETSSRNSEVIHAGIYYDKESLKTKLCIRGRQMLYQLCEQQGIPYKNCGKWIVAQDKQQLDALHKINAHCKTIGVPIKFISKEEGKRREPDVRAEAGILESPTTGIVDSHSYMQYLHGDFEDRGGIIALCSPTTKIAPLRDGAGGWEIWTSSIQPPDYAEHVEESCITAETIINSAGLFAIPVSNMILPAERHRTPYYAKGNYFSYSSSYPKPKTLIYPAPRPGFGGLGTHLTLDMGGRVRFGPDVEWIEDPNDYHVNDSRLSEALKEIETYLPGIDRDAVNPDYAGIRPKLGKLGAVASEKGSQDFYIARENGFEGFVNLLGIESPGLTSSLAIAEEVEKLLYK